VAKPRPAEDLLLARRVAQSVGRCVVCKEPSQAIAVRHHPTRTMLYGLCPAHALFLETR
jgi:hypothetical protein